MKIGITGITGLIGRHTAALARARGHEVIGFSRSPRRPGCRGFSIHETPDIGDCDGIVNLAGETVAGLWTPAKRRAIHDSRVLGTRRIVEAMRESRTPPRVLVSGSAIGIYGDTGEEAADEHSHQGTGFLAEVCEAWEQEALRAAELGVRVVLLRTSVALSREGGALAAMLPVFRLGLGGKLGNGRQWFSWIHIEDEAAMIMDSVEHPIHGPINATAPNPVRNVEFTRTLARVLHRPAFLGVPAFALRAAAGEFASEMLDSRRVLPTAAGEAGFRFKHPGLGEALSELLGGG